MGDQLRDEQRGDREVEQTEQRSARDADPSVDLAFSIRLALGCFQPEDAADDRDGPEDVTQKRDQREEPTVVGDERLTVARDQSSEDWWRWRGTTWRTRWWR
jgi:hypothetical protein